MSGYQQRIQGMDRLLRIRRMRKAVYAALLFLTALLMYARVLGEGASLKPFFLALDGIVEQRVPGARQAVGAPQGEAADGLHPGGDEHVTLAGPDRVHRHPGGLQAGRAVAGDRRAGQVIETEHDRDHPRHVVTLLAAGQAAAEHEVGDVGWVKLRDLGQGSGHHLPGQVVGPDGGEGSLERSPDR